MPVQHRWSDSSAGAGGVPGAHGPQVVEIERVAAADGQRHAVHRQRVALGDAVQPIQRRAAGHEVVRSGSRTSPPPACRPRCRRSAAGAGPVRIRAGCPAWRRAPAQPAALSAGPGRLAGFLERAAGHLAGRGGFGEALPLHAFWPLQALAADLQAPWPGELALTQWQAGGAGVAGAPSAWWNNRAATVAASSGAVDEVRMLMGLPHGMGCRGRGGCDAAGCRRRAKTAVRRRRAISPTVPACARAFGGGRRGMSRRTAGHGRPRGLA
jgi:hypothetical protein